MLYDFDIARFNRGTMLNDRNIEFLFRQILDELHQNNSDANIVALPTQFYNEYIRFGYDRVRRWFRRINIFGRDFVAVWINLRKFNILKFLHNELLIIFVVQNIIGPLLLSSDRD